MCKQAPARIQLTNADGVWLNGRASALLPCDVFEKDLVVFGVNPKTLGSCLLSEKIT